MRHAFTAAGSFARCGSGGVRWGCHGLGLLSRRRVPRLAFAREQESRPALLDSVWLSGKKKEEECVCVCVCVCVCARVCVS